MSIRFSVATLTFASFIFFFCIVVHAQTTRTWVSGLGDDFNPCNRTAPCKTFAGAIGKTNVNGEINCVDPGGYGTVTVTKSITIDCEDTQGSIVSSVTTGIVVNLTTSAANDPVSTVRIRGISFNGTAGCGADCGTVLAPRAIHVSSSNTRPVKLFVDECYIDNFVNEGILFNGPGGDLVVRDSLITNVIGSGGNAGTGIRAVSTLAGSTGIVHVAVTRTTVNACNQGIRFEGNVVGSIDHSVASNNALNGMVVFPITNGDAQMNISDSTASDNRQYGVFAGGTGFSGTARIFNLTSFNNATSQLEIQAGGSILSNGRNHIGTPSDAPGVFTDQ